MALLHPVAQGRRALSAAVGAALAACAPASSPALGPSAATTGVARATDPPGPIQHVIVVTIDGLMPEAYLDPDAHGLKVPVLRRLVAGGASSPGASSVFPSVTFPAHTSIASGVVPARHGIVSNLAFDPLDRNLDGWRWYAEDVVVPRVWDVAMAAGYRTALIEWPATVGEQATFLVPELWRAKTDEDLKLIRASSTPPGLFAAVAAAHPGFYERFRAGDIADEASADIAVFAIATGKPHLTFLHIIDVDGAQHEHGIWSDEARAAIEGSDRQLGRVLAASEQAGIASTTAVVIASDHGFAPVSRCVNPNALLSKAGLIDVDAQGRVSDWRATVQPNGGTAYVYARRPGDAALQAEILALLENAKRAPQSGIARILHHDEILAVGGDPDAFLALEAEPGVYFAKGRSDYETPTAMRGMHGYDPAHAEMNASLILYGPTIAPGVLASARLIDIAPTVASWLGLELANVDGKPLEVIPRAAGR